VLPACSALWHDATIRKLGGGSRTGPIRWSSAGREVYSLTEGAFMTTPRLRGLPGITLALALVVRAVWGACLRCGKGNRYTGV